MEKYDELARQVLMLAKTKLLSELRFLTEALTAPSYQPVDAPFLAATDGRSVYYQPLKVLESYRESSTNISNMLLHIMLHCIMGHPFCREKQNIRLWNLACDMAVEKTRMDLLGTEHKPVDESRQNELDRIGDFSGGFTARHFYNYFVDTMLRDEEIDRLSRLFEEDDHRYWYPDQKTGHSRQAAASSDLLENPEQEESEEDDPENLTQVRSSGEEQWQRSRQKQRKQWKRIAKTVKTELELFNKKQGLRSGTLVQELGAFLFEEVDYTEFLRVFGTENEIMHISDEEFDTIYYTYGLQLYENVPLIEPLEYSNQNRIRDFVIAIDTSGSVQGDVVEEFLRRTCQVLQQTNSFADQVNIYIVQCDSEIQTYTHITHLDELEQYIRNIRLQGFGGTDFRPVFSFVEQLLEEKTVTKINGLLYFTDGVGQYPEQEPPYKTAFIFNRDDYISPNVPEWAIKAVLTSDNIRMVKDKV